MHNYSRRNFLKTSSGLFALAIAGTSFDLKKQMPLLSFSTLGCPDWDFTTIINFAAANNYNGIELRGILRQLDLTKCPEFSTAANIESSLKFLKEKNLRFVDLGSSAELHHAEETTRRKNLNDAKRFIDMAQQLKCPYVRVFPNQLPKDQDRNATIDLIIKGLLELGEYAKGTDVTVLMESHGDLVQSDEVKKIMQAAENPYVGLVWDVVNMWSVSKEPPTAVYEKLKTYIRHTHIKDAIIVDGKDNYTLLGKGETPIFEAIDALYNGGYKGYFSFEWEKLWHPEIAEPEVALADYPLAMKQHFMQ